MSSGGGMVMGMNRTLPRWWRSFQTQKITINYCVNIFSLLWRRSWDCFNCDFSFTFLEPPSVLHNFFSMLEASTSDRVINELR